MKKLFLYAAMIGVVSFSACGGGDTETEENEENNETSMVDDLSNAYNMTKAYTDMGENLKEAVEGAEAKQKARKEKGDTLAMPYQELQKFLPEIDGFDPVGEAKGQTMNMQGMSYSTVEQKYSNGKETIKVSIMDYNAAYSMYTMATAIYPPGTKFEDNNQRVESFKKDDDLRGWEVYGKKSKDAELVYGVGYRFLVTIKADNQEDMDFVYDIADEMDMEAMAKL